MGLNLGSIVSAIAPIATQVVGALGGGGGAGGAGSALTGLAGALGGGAGGALGGAGQVDRDADAPSGGSQALSGLGSLLKMTDFAGIAKMVNPNLPKDQEHVFQNLGPYAGTFLQGALGGGGESAALGEKADPAKAGQYPGTPDEVVARANAKKVISQIDWSKPNLSIWVPGTGSHGMDPSFKKSMGNDTSTVAIEYPATIDFPGSVSTGMMTTKLVLEEVAKRGRTASLAGYSQGAWVAGEVMADPKAGKAVSRAVLFGHPNSANAQYENGENPKVRVVNNKTEAFNNMSTDLTPINGLSNLVRGRIDAGSIGGLLSGLVTHTGVVGQLLAPPPAVGQGHSYNLGSQSAFLKGR